MSYTRKARSENVKKQGQDEHGHFLPKEHFASTYPEIKGAPDILSHFVKTEHTDDDQTILDVKVSNPLHRIAQLLQDIKNHQATTFSLRFTIPLIALPIFLLAAFQLGRAQTSCSQTFSSQVGTIRTLQVLVPKDSPNPLFSLFSFFPALPTLQKPSELIPKQHTILLNTQGEPITILYNNSIELASFQNQPVIITGNYSACTRSITLDTPQNITLVNQAK